jgi:hypothetical protein
LSYVIWGNCEKKKGTGRKKTNPRNFLSYKGERQLHKLDF